MRQCNINETRGSIYLFINNKLLNESSTDIETIYKRFKDEDGYLYINFD